jgi:hypothetical protein
VSSSPRPQPAKHSIDAQMALDRLVEATKLLCSTHPEVQRRFQAWRRDGYPSGSSGGGRGGGPSIVVDDETGRPDRVPVTSVEAAMFDRDEIAERHMAYLGGISEALGVIMGVLGQNRWVLADTEEVKKAKKRQNTLQACANQFGCPTEAFSDNDRGRCTTCANFLRKHGRDRTARYDREAS